MDDWGQSVLRRDCIEFHTEEDNATIYDSGVVITSSRIDSGPLASRSDCCRPPCLQDVVLSNHLPDNLVLRWRAGKVRTDTREHIDDEGSSCRPAMAIVR